ncbi:MAG: GTP cyclohydrolase I FolE [Halanaerobiales bacterium]
MWAVETILAAIGENPEREGLLGTPERVARMYLSELSIGTEAEYGEVLSATFNEEHDEMVVIKDIQYYSLCEHHMVPYFGKAHIAYIPDGEVVGLSKIARLVEKVTSTLSIQENVTSIIADTIMEELAPKGVMVIINGEHLCMAMRGIKKPGANTTTSAVRGVFKDNSEGEVSPRQEFLDLLKL